MLPFSEEDVGWQSKANAGNKGFNYAFALALASLQKADGDDADLPFRNDAIQTSTENVRLSLESLVVKVACMDRKEVGAMQESITSTLQELKRVIIVC